MQKIITEINLSRKITEKIILRMKRYVERIEKIEDEIARYKKHERSREQKTSPGA